MNKKAIKIISILAIVLVSIMFATTCFAGEIDITKIDGKDGSVDSNKMQSIGNKIATIVRNVGMVAAVVILMVVGIKYMLGSAEEKAEYKKVMMPYIIGALILFGASGIAQTVITVSGSLVG